MAIFQYASGSPHDILGCGMWCMVSRTSVSKTRRGINWLCWEVYFYIFQLISSTKYEENCSNFNYLYFSHYAGLETWSQFELASRRDGYLKYFSPSPMLTERKYVQKSLLQVYYIIAIIYYCIVFEIDSTYDNWIFFNHVPSILSQILGGHQLFTWISFIM